MISGLIGQEMPFVGLVYYQHLRHMVSDKFQGQGEKGGAFILGGGQVKQGVAGGPGGVRGAIRGGAGGAKGAGGFHEVQVEGGEDGTISYSYGSLPLSISRCARRVPTTSSPSSRSAAVQRRHPHLLSDLGEQHPCSDAHRIMVSRDGLTEGV